MVSHCLPHAHSHGPNLSGIMQRAVKSMEYIDHFPPPLPASNPHFEAKDQDLAPQAQCSHGQEAVSVPPSLSAVLQTYLMPTVMWFPTGAQLPQDPPASSGGEESAAGGHAAGHQTSRDGTDKVFVAFICSITTEEAFQNVYKRILYSSRGTLPLVHS